MMLLMGKAATTADADFGGDGGGLDYEALFLDYPDPLLVVEQGTFGLLKANRAALDIYQYTAAEYADLTLADIEPVPEPASLSALGSPGIKNHRRKSGEMFQVRVRERPVQYEGRNAILLIIQTLEDVTGLFGRPGEEFALALSRLQEREANLRLAKQLLKIGFWKYDIPARKLIWSQSLYEMAGIEPHEFDGSVESYIKILYADDRQAAAQAVKALDDPGMDYLELERRLTRKDGTTVYIKGVGQRTQTYSGDVITGVVQDVTTERLREGQLRLLGASIERLNDIIVIMRVDASLPGTDAPIVYINSAFERATGYSQRDIIGRPLSFILSYAEPKIDARLLEATLSAGQSLRFELAAPVRTDRWATWDIEFLPVADEKGKYSHWVAVARDISDKRQAEQKAALNEDRFQLVSRSTEDVVWEWDVTTDQIFWSEAFDKLTGSAGAHLDTNLDSWSRRIHPDDRGRAERTLRETAVSPYSQSWSEEYRFLREDGSERVILDRGFVVRDEAGRSIRMVGTMIDMTERRASEQRSRESERLEAVGQLTGGVAHDFNNLLTVIMGNSDALKDMLHDPSQRRMAELIHLAASRGSDLTRRLLAFARRQPLRPQNVCLNERTGSVHALLRGALDARIRIHYIPAPDLWPALVDPGQFDVAILNLAFNGRDAMPDGGALTISTENMRVRGRSGIEREGVPAGDYVCITVTDTGTGMDDVALRRAYEPFFTTKPAGKGSGLGLSMVYGFVKQSDGQILIRSVPGEGTSVRLFFPRAGENADAAPDQAALGSEEAAPGTGLVLIVEDDPLVREHAAHSFESLGYSVLLAGTAEQALSELARRDDILLMFTDIILGAGMNGVELGREAKRLRPSLRILYTSGFVPGDKDARAPLRVEGELLRKPYERPELQRKVNRVLNIPPAEL